MIRLSVNDQELFEIILALHMFGKNSAVPHTDERELAEFEELACRREHLLDRLHAAFDEAVTAPFLRSTGAPSADSLFGY